MYERAVQYDPGNSERLFALGMIYWLGGRGDKVQALLERALALNPTREMAAVNLGQFLIAQRGDVEGARRVMRGRGPIAQIGLANTYWLTRDYEEAIRLIEKLPADSAAFEPFFQTKDEQLGLYLHDAGHEEHARSLLEPERDRLNALLTNKTLSARGFMFTSMSLARIELALGNRDAAIQCLRAAGAQSDTVNRDPINGRYYQRDMARIYARASRNDEAIAVISEFLKSGCGNTGITPITLRLDPDWDLLREDPRFQALLKEYPAEVRLR